MSHGGAKVSSFPPEIDKKYKLLRELGQGAYGVVCSARVRETGELVAVKKIQRVIEKPIFAKRTLREIKLLKHFNGHENITPLIDIVVPDALLYTEIYLVQELMEADLHQIIRSGQPLTDDHYQYFVYQICRGLKYIHSANVLHRDLKPGNLLVNADCELKICDFGLARGLTDNPTGFMTEYVATRWYRAPEIMLSFKSYTKAVDIWSVGCIFAELLGGKPIFKGRDYVDQLNQILEVLGTPDSESLNSVGSLRAQLYIKSLPKSSGHTWESLYPQATRDAVDFLSKLLVFDPSSRITAEEALEHPYLKVYHDPGDEVGAFERLESINDMKCSIIKEIEDFKAQKSAKKQGSVAPWLTNRVKENLQGFNPTSVKNVSKDKDESYTGAMDLDEELRLRESSKH